jgi:hypothetical protein
VYVGGVILESAELSPAEFERLTGWEIKPEGACRDSVCVPLPDRWSLGAAAARLGMPLVEDAQHGLWSLGPESGPVLRSAQAPDLVLPDWHGDEFRLTSLRGHKIFLLAWASW